VLAAVRDTLDQRSSPSPQAGSGLDAGGRAALVPQILGRYRVQQGSMIALTNLATDEAIDAIRQRYPRLPWPVETQGSG
jgi:hypothetical protein